MRNALILKLVKVSVIHALMVHRVPTPNPTYKIWSIGHHEIKSLENTGDFRQVPVCGNILGNSTLW